MLTNFQLIVILPQMRIQNIFKAVKYLHRLIWKNINIERRFCLWRDDFGLFRMKEIKKAKDALRQRKVTDFQSCREKKE
jgi:hypothetical protein